MKIVSQRSKNLKKLITKPFYKLTEALELLKLFTLSTFTETIELHIRVNLLIKNIQKFIRATIMLPYAEFKAINIAVLIDETSDPLPFSTLGIKIIGADAILPLLQKNQLKVDLLLVAPTMVPTIIKYGKILNSKNLMPSLKNGTITSDLIQAIHEFQRGKFEYRSDKTGIIHTKLGTSSLLKQNFTHIIKNFFIIYQSILQNKPEKITGTYIKSIHICLTMSPSLRLDLTTLLFHNL